MVDIVTQKPPLSAGGNRTLHYDSWRPRSLLEFQNLNVIRTHFACTVIMRSSNCNSLSIFTYNQAMQRH